MPVSPPRPTPPPRNGSANTGRPGPCALALGLLLLALAGWAPGAHALVRFDFEQKYFRHPGRQVWDFSIVRAADVYHIYYHTIPLAALGAANADTIWHATSPDLRHWAVVGPVLVTAGAAAWEQGALWAPSVARDDADNCWVMLYTGCDAAMNQRIGLARSTDLDTWTRDPANPVVEPDSTQYLWSVTSGWSDFRDPFLYRQDDQWHVLVSARQWRSGQATGVLYHAVSPDLIHWQDTGPVFANDGTRPGLVLESSQYRVFGQWHHLFFGEFDATGVTILSATDPADWTMATRRLLDAGYAPQIDTFDPDVHLYSRLGAYPLNVSGALGYVVRVDTLRTNPDGSSPAPWLPHPLDADWEVHSGAAALGNPVFGDNPRFRGEAPVGLVGNCYFGSREYYPGPLSGRGTPGAMLGDAVTGRLESRPFTVTGTRMDLLVGGGNFPNTCYVALVDADDGSVLHSETGLGVGTMSPRAWDLTADRGRRCRIVIVDQESATGGHLNVDEIVESDESIAAVPSAGGGLSALTVAPNPANPSARIAFRLGQPGPVTVSVFDLRGRRVWQDGPTLRAAGAAAVTWPGCDAAGRPLASGTYLVRVRDGAGRDLNGRLTLLK